MAYVGATIGRPPTYRSNAFFRVVCLQGKRARASNARPQRVEKTSLCETDSPDTGEVALAPEGERCPEGAEGENLAIARNISDSRTVLSPTACGRSPLAEGAKG